MVIALYITVRITILCCMVFMGKGEDMFKKAGDLPGEGAFVRHPDH